MTTAKIRKIAVFVDEIHTEMGKTIDPPTRRAAAVAVIENPFAGKYVDDLSELMTIGEELGGLLGERCVAAIGISPAQAESYGKAAMVGEAGELEHAAAILHPKLGAPLREAVGGGAGPRPDVKSGLQESAALPRRSVAGGLCRISIPIPIPVPIPMSTIRRSVAKPR